MSTITLEKEALASVLKDTHDFVKLGQALFGTQFDEDIREEAEKTASYLVNKGEVAEEDKARVIEQMIFNKKATYDGMRKLADKISDLRQKVDEVGLGVGISKAASTEGTSEDKPSERIWTESFGTPRH